MVLGTIVLIAVGLVLIDDRFKHDDWLWACIGRIWAKSRLK